MKCCICGIEIKGYGNNPEPVRHDGECCDSCNGMYVIPARLKIYFGTKNDKKEEVKYAVMD